MLLAIWLPEWAAAQTDSTQTGAFEASVGELLQLRKTSEEELTTNIASGAKVQTVRESPGIISLITKEEIRLSGARDLIDVLRMVPGIEFAWDVYGVVGLTMRGNWSNEGKVLLMVDGIPSNDILYGTNQIGGRISVNQIERIEIIRGPGSAVYGGWAALGVINILTVNTAERNHLTASVTRSQAKGTFGQEALDLAFGRKTNSGVQVQFNAFQSTSRRGNGSYTEPNGSRYSDKAPFSHIHQQLLNLMVKWRGWSLQMLHDNYRHEYTGDTAAVGSLRSPRFVSTVAFPLMAFRLSHEHNGEKWTWINRFSYNRQFPWRSNTFADSLIGSFTDQLAQRWQAESVLSGDLSERLSLLAGAEIFYDQASTFPNVPLSSRFRNPQGNLTDRVGNFTAAPFAQLTWNSPWLTVTAGGRYQYNNAFEGVFVPRLSLNKIMGKWHAKALLSRAFRAPNLQNIALTPNIRPEITEIAEAEIGWQASERSTFTANAFANRIFQPIVFANDGTNDGVGSYQNADRVGTVGLEGEYRYRSRKSFFTLGYSHYQAWDNRVALYTVRDTRTGVDQGLLLLGSAAHKLTATSAIQWQQWSISPSWIWLSERYASQLNERGEASITAMPALHLVHLHVTYKDLLTKGLQVSFGVSDLLNQHYYFAQGYAGGLAPLPAMGREWTLRILYQLGL